MDFAFTPEQEALRHEVRAFIKREMTPEVIAEMEAHHAGRPVPRSGCRTPSCSPTGSRSPAGGCLGHTGRCWTARLMLSGRDFSRTTRWVLSSRGSITAACRWCAIRWAAVGMPRGKRW